MRCLCLPIILGACLPALAQAAPIDALRARLTADVQALLPTMELLTGVTGAPPILSRSVFHGDLGRAEDALIAALEEIDGLIVWTEEVTINVELDGEDVEVTGLRNVIAELPGRDVDGPLVLVGSHLDSTAKASPGGWDARTDPAPGADDDASGVAAGLAMARTLAGWEGGFDAPIRWVFFTAEEVGLLGSAAYVDGLLADGAEIEAMVQMDPIGFNGTGADRLWFAWDARWEDLRTQADAAAAAADTWLAVQGVDAALIGGDARSDHWRFWEAGWPALHFGAFPPPPDYHKTSDTLDVVDLPFLAEVTRVLTLFVAELAVPLDPPDAPAEAGCSCGVGAPPERGRPVAAMALALAALSRRRRQ